MQLQATPCIPVCFLRTLLEGRCEEPCRLLDAGMSQCDELHVDLPACGSPICSDEILMSDMVPQQASLCMTAHLWDWEAQKDGLHQARACCDVPDKAPLILWLQVQKASPLLQTQQRPTIRRKIPSKCLYRASWKASSELMTYQAQER